MKAKPTFFYITFFTFWFNLINFFFKIGICKDQSIANVKKTNKSNKDIVVKKLIINTASVKKMDEADKPNINIID